MNKKQLLPVTHCSNVKIDMLVTLFAEPCTQFPPFVTCKPTCLSDASLQSGKTTLEDSI